MERPRWQSLLILAAILPGCDPGLEKNLPASGRIVVQKPPHPVIGKGSPLRGKVVWKGEIPTVPSYQAPISSLTEHIGGVRRPWPNPNAPRINKSSGIANAVVYLLNAPATGDWPHPQVTAVTENFQLRLEQGDYSGPVGFVNKGGSLRLENRQDFLFLIRGRGESYFSLPLLKDAKLEKRNLEQLGIITLSSGSGQFWMRSYLFVMDHPWIARTNAMGEFEIPSLPPGNHTFKVWLPNWKETNREIDAETWEVNRIEFASPLEKTFTVDGTNALVEISGSEFVPGKPTAPAAPYSKQP